jgi:predicted transcriptional regulator
MRSMNIEIDDDLLKRIEEIALREGRTLSAVANDLLRQALARKAGLELRGWEAVEQPGVDLLSRQSLFDLTDGR